MYGFQNKDFLKGFLAALDAYSIWKDGKRTIGCLNTEVTAVMKYAIKEMYVDAEKFTEEFFGKRGENRSCG
jgi:hypothetical protein